MEQYISKSALLAEIERRLWLLVPKMTFHQQRVELEKLLSFIDTLEVKEVDLDYIKDKLDRVVKIYKPDGDFGWGTLYNIATHFFELGLKAQKGEEV